MTELMCSNILKIINKLRNFLHSKIILFLSKKYFLNHFRNFLRFLQNSSSIHFLYTQIKTLHIYYIYETLLTTQLTIKLQFPPLSTTNADFLCCCRCSLDPCPLFAIIGYHGTTVWTPASSAQTRVYIQFEKRALKMSSYLRKSTGLQFNVFKWIQWLFFQCLYCARQSDF